MELAMPEAVAAVERAMDGDALEDALLALWRATRDPVVADLLIELEGQLDARRPEPEGATWVDTVGRRVAARLRWVRRGQGGDAIAARLEAVAGRDLPDPRYARFAVELLTSSPSSRNVPLNQALFDVLEQCRDPATVPDVRRIAPLSPRVRAYGEPGQPMVACRFAPRFPLLRPVPGLRGPQLRALAGNRLTVPP